MTPENPRGPGSRGCPSPGNPLTVQLGSRAVVPATGRPNVGVPQCNSGGFSPTAVPFRRRHRKFGVLSRRPREKCGRGRHHGTVRFRDSTRLFRLPPRKCSLTNVGNGPASNAIPVVGCVERHHSHAGLPFQGLQTASTTKSPALSAAGRPLAFGCERARSLFPLPPSRFGGDAPKPGGPSGPRSRAVRPQHTALAGKTTSPVGREVAVAPGGIRPPGGE